MIDLYAAPTPNGWKASVPLAELGLPYATHAVDLSKNVQVDKRFKAPLRLEVREAIDLSSWRARRRGAFLGANSRRELAPGGSDDDTAARGCPGFRPGQWCVR